MKLHWQIQKPPLKSVQAIRNAIKCSHIIASILANRNISSESDARFFVSPMIKNIRDPFSLKDMDIGVSRISKAIANNEKILIFADYDTDGITGATILFKFLQYVGANLSCYIPHREKQGYGIKPEHINQFAIKENIDLIITVDCGSSDYEAMQIAESKGIDVIITDHHHVANPGPSALALINPKQDNCNSGLNHLAGVGVVFFLLICLRKHLRDINFWKNLPEPNLKEYCDLVALGTVADIVPLIHENRILTYTGINILNHSKRPGIKALISVSNLKSQDINAEDIAFKLAPRLNAAGRMDHAKIAFELLCTDSMKKARTIAESLDKMNTERQSTQNQIINQIELFLEKNQQFLDQKTLVLYNNKWHEGVLGIVAARLTKKYYRPVILISLKNKIGTGSARSIHGVDLYKSLTACSSDLETYGGHSMAAGLKIVPQKIKQFMENFENVVQKTALPDAFIPKILIDFELNFSSISEQFIDQLESLGPYGSGNPEPLFMSKNVDVVYSEIVGENHRRMRLKQSSDNFDKPITAIQFKIDTKLAQARHFDKIAYSLKWNYWNNRKTVQMLIKATEP